MHTDTCTLVEGMHNIKYIIKIWDALETGLSKLEINIKIPLLVIGNW
jgi:hypothetical protein|tara:strand:- start:331 stop:471 length:141 start_codon:yes stop_codon:yes gene_type:complete